MQDSLRPYPSAKHGKRSSRFGYRSIVEDGLGGGRRRAALRCIRERGPLSDSERSVWAFERALLAARIDASLLRHLLVACVCLVAHEEGETPRTVLERVVARSVTANGVKSTLLSSAEDGLAARDLGITYRWTNGAACRIPKSRIPVPRNRRLRPAEQRLRRFSHWEASPL